MKKIVEEIMKDVQDQINDDFHELNDPDEASWNYQVGVLISVNSAKTILYELSRLQAENDELRKRPRVNYGPL